MADPNGDIDLDSVIDRLLEGEIVYRSVSCYLSKALSFDALASVHYISHTLLIALSFRSRFFADLSLAAAHR